MATDPRRLLVERLFVLERLANQLGDEAEALIRALFDDIVTLLDRLDPTSVLPRYRKGRLDELRERVRKLTGSTYDEMYREQRAALARLGAQQAGAATLELRAVLGAGGAGRLSSGIGLGLNHFKTILDSRPLQGALFQDWTRKMGTETAFRVEQQVQLGMSFGETIEDIVRRVRGRRVSGPRRFTGGVMETSTRHARNLVRTAVNDVSNTARVETFEANADILAGLRFVSALDERVCQICGALDGTLWKLGDPAIRKPPLHWGDRCTLVPEPDWAGLGMDPPPDGTRASSEGQVPSSVTYEEWLRGLPASEQDEILGPARGKLFRAGRVTLTQMVASDGRRLRLDELAPAGRE